MQRTTLPTDAALTPVEPEPGVLVHTRADRELAIVHWLLAAAGRHTEARMQWAEHGIALLRCGTLFSAIRIPEVIVHAAAGTEEADKVDAYLAEALLQGPVIRDPRQGRYYALVPASTAARWRAPDTDCLGRGWHLGVPRPGVNRDAPDVWCPYWSVPMPSPGELCSAGAVAQLVATGRYRQASEALG
ncbi:hypothetical protein [Streptomyces flaveus]|uniref:DNA primase/polymerase bifunctional N-terminal domain-containing protein n=1 Tax=Streptomyces flaveus TaxID=66370 RepID=A0A917QRH4_9ACTN|nr:hypothetical protein [Streptomyces flaveus]GGK63639.1 hypothetical protein GCM10010094_25590 [Streptomyces flaveus]